MEITAEMLGLLEKIKNRLIDERKTVATCESCTAGLLGYILTYLPGSSSYYEGGVVSYSNKLKSKFCNVDKKVLLTKGAVSAEVAEAMADGTLRACEADYGISLTGIAGPDGGTKEKPVGTVWLGLACRESSKSILLKLDGNRNEIRRLASFEALKNFHDFIC